MILFLLNKAKNIDLNKKLMYNRKVILYIERKKSMVKKKMISGLVSLAMCVSTLTAPIGEANVGEWKIGQDAKAAAEASNGYKAEGTDSIGRFLADSLSNNQSSCSMETTVCRICNVKFYEMENRISVQSIQDQDCILDVSIFDDDTQNLAKTYETERKAGNEEYTDIQINRAELPEYFTIKAVLKNKLGMELSKPFTNEQNARYIQELNRSDIYDYPEEKVVNLDEKDDTNFMILNEEVVRAESNSEVNVLVSSDYEKGIFVFENADETLNGLEKGDKLFIESSGEKVALQVEKIKEKDGKVEITEDKNEPIDNMFDCIKIDSEINLGNAEINPDAPNDFDSAEINRETSSLVCSTVKPLGTVNDLSLNDYLPEKNDNFDSSSFDNNYSFTKDLPSPDLYLTLKGLPKELEIMLQANTDANINGHLYYSKKLTKVNIAFELGLDVKMEVGVGIGYYGGSTPHIWDATLDEIEEPDASNLDKIEALYKLKDELNKFKDIYKGNEKEKEKEIELPEVEAPVVPGLSVRLSPALLVTIEGMIETSLEMKGSIGFAYIDGKVTNIGQPFHLENVDVKVVGKISVGIRLAAGVALLHKIASASLTASFGVTLSGEVSSSDFFNINNMKDIEDDDKTFNFIEEDAEEVHLCFLSVDIGLSAYFDIGYKVGIDLVPSLMLTDSLLNITTPDFLHIHYEMKPIKKLTFGECENYAYRVTMDASELLNDSSITLTGIEVDGVKITKENNTARFYSKTGKHNLKIMYKTDSSEITKNGTFEINDKAIRLTKSNVSFESSTSTSSVSSGEKVTTEKVDYSEPLYEMTGDYYTDIQEALSDNNLDNIIDSGALGDNISYILYNDGLLYISGYGPIINDINNLRLVGRQSTLIKNIVIENTRDIYREQIYENGITGEELEQLEKECEFELSDSAVITEIGDNWFYNCDNLESVTMPDTIERIGVYAFHAADNLKDLYVTYWDKDSTGKYFYNKGGFDKSNVKTIGYGAFWNCKLSNNFAFNDSLEYIGGQAFQSCSCLTDIVIPDSVTFIGNSAFSGCTNLKTVDIGFGIKNIYNGSIDDELDNSIKTSVFNGCNIDTLKVPVLNYILDGNPGGLPDGLASTAESVSKIIIKGQPESIPDKAFQFIENLKSVEIPDSVKIIGSEAFRDCKSLEEIVLPSSLKNIKYGAFCYSDALETVYYNGTDDEWNAITIEKNNDSLLNAKRQNRAGYVIGDINEDKVADLTDLQYLSIYLMNKSGFTETQLKEADVDENKEVDIADLAYFKQYVSKDMRVISKLRIGEEVH